MGEVSRVGPKVPKNVAKARIRELQRDLRPKKKRKRPKKGK